MKGENPDVKPQQMEWHMQIGPAAARPRERPNVGQQSLALPGAKPPAECRCGSDPQGSDDILLEFLLAVRKELG